MNIELTMLTWTVALWIAQLLVAVTGGMMQFPAPVLAGNRETPVEGKGWVGRAQRALRNLAESLLPFAALVLVAHAVGVSNSMTVMGAQLFFYARVAYAVVYIAGIPWLRTAVWTVGFVGLLMILAQLV
ncbi:MAG: MAPEG family protein [Steroidobacteraceae bacterium]|nr:MAPEG family protein [Steroidobacteraceae bacterium]